MNREWVVDLCERLPQATVSRAWGWLARRQRPRLGVTLLKRAFVAAVRVDMSEARDGIDAYATLEELFVRRLRPGARRVEPEPKAVVSPVDGRVGSYGKIADGTLLQVKGRQYQVARLLDDPEAASRFEGGQYLTLYLAPSDYHRIHSPVSGQVSEATLVPGALMPVFQEAVERCEELFARNERVVTYIDSPDAGRVALVKVGATLVGRITVTYDPSLRTNLAGQERRRLAYDPPRLLQKGAEVGAFELGSTVVLLAEKGRIRLERLELGQAVRMGQRIGTIVARARRGKAAAEPGKVERKARAARKRPTRSRT